VADTKVSENTLLHILIRKLVNKQLWSWGQSFPFLKNLLADIYTSICYQHTTV